MSYRELGYVGLGLFLGILAAVFVNHARAATDTPLSVVESLWVGYDYQSVQKVYDKNNGVTCYIAQLSNGGGISCVK